MGITSKIKKHINSYIEKKNCQRIEKAYLDKAKKSNKNVSNFVGDDEKQHISKWKRISKYVSPIDYRLFSQFIGKNPDIVPEYVLHNVIEPVFLPRTYQQFYNDKNMYDKLLPKEFLAESLFRCIDGFFYDGEYLPLYRCDDKKLFDLCKHRKKIIVKPTRDTGNGSRILFYTNKESFFEPLRHDVPFTIKKLSDYYEGNFIVQQCLEQSSFTAGFNKASVNTFRVFTYKSVKDNEPHVIGIVFRMGKLNSMVDNNHAGGRYIGVHHDGSFANSCVFDQYGNTYTEFNNIDFSKEHFIVPDFDIVLEFSKAVAEKILHNRTLDLDVMIDAEGQPKLVEFNVDMCSPWLYQFTVGPVYGKFTEEVIEYIEKL